MRNQEPDQCSAYFDDLWAYRLGGEKQECCVWAIDAQKNTRTPLKLDFAVGITTSSSSPPQLRLINSNQPWVFRKEMNKSECEGYLKVIMDLQTACDNANWQRGPMYTEDNSLKLSQLL